MRVRYLTILLLSLPSSFAAANDCSLGERYMLLARDRMANFATDDAQGFLRQAIAACPTYDAYQQLGELAAQSPEQEDKVAAAEAFVSAHEVAPTDSARAQSLLRYAQMLNRDGDPQNAYSLIKAATTLDSANPEITTLAQTIEEQIRSPTTEQLVRGLKSQIYRPLRVAAITPAKKVPAAASAPTKAATAMPSGPSLNIPINFVTGSTVVDEQTRPNLGKLVEALRDPSLASQMFVFVGHADARGDEQRNMVLSWQRAEAIYSEVLQADPGLQGRVQVSGRGEYEPIDPGKDDNAYRANRRLQVLLK